MLITITNHDTIQVADISKDDRMRIVGSNGTISLFNTLDDLLSIDWIQMASDLFYGIGDLVIEQEFDSEYPFSDYETFHQWLHDHHCLHKDSISPITFDLLKTQFPSFREETWDRFYNALIFLNTEAYFTNLDPYTRRELFVKMFPQTSFFSPFAKEEKHPITMLSKYVFSSNLEMLVYDIMESIYEGECETCTEPYIRSICAHLLSEFKLKKQFAEVTEYNYSVERFITDFFETDSNTKISSDTFDRIQLLFNFLCSRDFYNFLSVEYNMSEHDRTRYGQERIPISFFVDSDLNARFNCKEYLYNCYSKYEITSADIFYLHNDVNLLLLLGLYASGYSKLSFGQCNTCGHYFVRDFNNRAQVQCNRCKDYVASFLDVTEIQQQDKAIQRSHQTALSRMKKDTKNADSSFSQLLGTDKKGSKNEANHQKRRQQIIDLYDLLIREYRKKIEEVILLLSQEHLLWRYDAMDLFGFVELQDQIEQEKKMIPICSTQHGMLDFDFYEFYKENLRKKEFFSIFELANISLEDKGNFQKASLQLQITFAKMRSIFLSYNLDDTVFIEIYQAFCSILDKNYSI